MLFDLVVTRLEIRAEVMRTPADIGNPKLLLETMRSDLEAKPVGDFWRVEDAGLVQYGLDGLDSRNRRSRHQHRRHE